MINNPLDLGIRLRLDQSTQNQFINDMRRLMDRAARMGGGMLGAAGGFGESPVSGANRSFGQNMGAYFVRAIMGRGGMSGMLGRLGAGMFGFGGGVNSLPAMATQAVGVARQQEQAYSDLNRRVGDSMRTYDDFRQSVVEVGRAVGLTRQQIISLTDAYVSGVGKMTNATMSRNLQDFVLLAKGLGIAPETITGAQTSFFRAGVTAPGGGGTARGANGVIAAAIAAGGMRGREDETVKELQTLIDLLEQRLPTVTEQNFQTTAALMTAFNATGIQGLMGTRGQALIGGLDQTIMSRGGPQQALMFSALQMGRAASGQAPLDLYGLYYQTEKGIGSAENLRALASVPGVFGGGGKMGNFLFSKLTGETLHQTEDVLPALQGLLAGGGAGFNRMSSALGGANVNPSALPYLARMYGGEDASTVLREFTATLDKDTQSRLGQELGGSTNPDDIARVMNKFAKNTDAMLTEQDEATKSLNNFNNSLVDLAKEMLPAVTGSLKALTNIVDIVGGGLHALNDVVDMANVTFGILTAVTAAQAVAAGGSALGNILGLAPGTAGAVLGGRAVATGGLLGAGARAGLTAPGVGLAVGGGLLAGGLFSMLYDKIAHPNEPTGMDMILQSVFGITTPWSASRPTASTGSRGGSPAVVRGASGAGSAGRGNLTAGAAGSLMAQALAAQMGIAVPAGAADVFAQQAQIEMGDYAGSLGRVNNNPFNLRPIPGGWPGQIGENNGFAVFGTWQEGVQAAAQNLMANDYRGVRSAFAGGSQTGLSRAIEASPWDSGHYGWGNLTSRVGGSVDVNVNLNLPDGSKQVVQANTPLTSNYKGFNN